MGCRINYDDFAHDFVNSIYFLGKWEHVVDSFYLNPELIGKCGASSIASRHDIDRTFLQAEKWVAQRLETVEDLASRAGLVGKRELAWFAAVRFIFDHVSTKCNVIRAGLRLFQCIQALQNCVDAYDRVKETAVLEKAVPKIKKIVQRYLIDIVRALQVFEGRLEQDLMLEMLPKEKLGEVLGRVQVLAKAIKERGLAESAQMEAPVFGLAPPEVDFAGW